MELFDHANPPAFEPSSSPDILTASTEGTSDNSAGDTDDLFIFPATPAQRRFWLLDQLQPGGNPALNLSIALRWTGLLDIAALRSALQQLVARHEALRTTFDTERGQLRQLIAPTLHVDLAVDDELTATTAEQLAIEEISRPLDLRSGPLVRARLVRPNSAEHLLLLTVHHIVSDGWSNGILTRDLCAFYGAAVGGSAPLPAVLDLQFADYAEWQTARLSEDAFAAQRTYWREKLAGDLPGLDLPLDHPRSANSATSGAICSCLLSPDLVRAAKSYAAAENASPFMVFFALFQVLLHRYTGQTDFLVTSPSANRELAEFEDLVGLFVNPLLLRANLQGDPTFRELLTRVRQTALEAFSNHDIPFESLLDEFQAPQLQVNFHYDGGLQQLLPVIPEVTLELLPAVSTGTVYELSLSVLEEQHGNVRLEVEYNPALFEAATMERLLGHYQTLLRSAVHAPAVTISTLELLSAEEQEFPSPPDCVPPFDLRALLTRRVMAQSDAVAARHGKRELSYAELLARIETQSLGDQDSNVPSDLQRVAAWIAHWRARLETTMPPPVALTPATEMALAAAGVALRDCAELKEGERISSASIPGLGATEELVAVFLAGATLVYPTAELLANSPTAFAAWLDVENIAVAFLPAATWHRLTFSIVSRKARKLKLRLAVAIEGPTGEGTISRIRRQLEREANGTRVVARTVVDAAGGTIAIDGRLLRNAGARLRVVDVRSGQTLPRGLVGELAVIEEGSTTSRTGEIARFLPGETLQMLGRAAEQQYRQGFRIDRQRIEEVLCAAPGIRHVIIRPAKAGSNGELIAYLLVEPTAGMLPGNSALRQLLREARVPEFAIPTAFIQLHEIALRADNGQLNLAAFPPFSARDRNAEPEPVRPYLGLQLQLIAIWEEVLGVQGIGIRDNFFDLGGNSLLALRMLQRAETACQKSISPATLFRHPTIEHLAGEMGREATDESPPLLRVHDSGSRTPFFYLHGDLSGGGFYSLKLSRALGADQPFYVMPPQDIRSLPLVPTIEEMASHHLEALRAIRPHGPYVIGGFCIGGLVAYELAQQLRAAGEEVEMLLVIDAVPDRTLRRLRTTAVRLGAFLHWDDAAILACFGRWAIWRTRLALRFAPVPVTQPRTRFRRLQHRWKQLTPRSRSAVVDQPMSAASQLAEKQPAERDLPTGFQWAAGGFRPKRYDGPVALLLSEDVVGRADNVLRTWRSLAAKATLEPLRGNHLECITAHVGALAETIERCLEGVAAQPHAQDAASVHTDNRAAASG